MPEVLKEQCHCTGILAKLEKNKMADVNARLHRRLKFQFGNEKIWPLRNLKIQGNQCHNDILLSGRGCNLIRFLYHKKDWAEVCNMIWRT